MNLLHKKVAVLGCGRSGIAAARLAAANGAAHVCIFDSDPDAVCPESTLNFVPGAGEKEARNFAADLVVISPGIEANTPWSLAFTCAGAPIIGEVELASRYFHGRIIAITGTNGKTTTTALIEHILTAAGRTAKACGNYGYPFCEVALADPQPEFAVLEISSFQLETIASFKPEVAVWLNFAPDHMDRYKTVEDYYHAKLRIFENMTKDQIAIVRVGEHLPSIKPCVVEFSAFAGNGVLRFENGCIMQLSNTVADLNGSVLRQAHNAENAMAAILACRAVGLSDEQIVPALADFAPPHHRCEFVAEEKGVLWLNDSKSTNLHSTEAAIRSQTRPIILLIGGKDKGLDYTPLLPLMRKKVRLCIVFGQIAKQLENVFKTDIETLRVETVPQAVQAAAARAHTGDVVLFSPGSSSFDQFTSYAERGNCFCDTVRSLTVSLTNK